MICNVYKFFVFLYFLYFCFIFMKVYYYANDINHDENEERCLRWTERTSVTGCMNSAIYLLCDLIICVLFIIIIRFIYFVFIDIFCISSDCSFCDLLLLLSIRPAFFCCGKMPLNILVTQLL